MDKSEIIAYMDQFQHLPNINEDFSKIISMLNTSDELSIDKLVDEISICPNLRKSLLTTINSENFKMPRKAETLKDSIMYLGLNTVKRLVLAYMIRSILPDNLGRSDEIDKDKYLKHCLGTSIAAIDIAEKLNIGEKYKYFAYGLIHDIGNAAIDICLPGIINEVTEIQSKGVNQIVAEREVMKGCTHCEIGSWICKKWNLPEDIQAIVAHHHDPLVETKYKMEVAIVNLADSINTLYYEKLLYLNNFYIINEETMKYLGLTMRDVEKIGNSLPNKIDNFFSNVAIEACL